MSFQNKFPEVLNDVDALTDGKMSSGTSLSIEQKRAHQSSDNEYVTSETSHFFNPPPNNFLSRAGKEPSDLLLRHYLLARVWKEYFDSKSTSDYPFLVRKSSNTGEGSRNASSLGLGIGNAMLMGDNSAKGKEPANPIDNTINVNVDKDICVASMIPTLDKEDVTSDFYIDKPRRSTRSVVPPKWLDDYFWEGRKTREQGQSK